MIRHAMLALTAILLASGPSWAGEMTARRARALVERTCGVSLAGAELKTETVCGTDYAEFASRGAAGTRRFTVDLTRGYLRSWSAPYPADGAPARLSEAEALAKAKETARQCMGSPSETLEWSPGVSHSSSPTLEFHAHGKPVGAPPLPGLWPTCSVEVSLVDGQVPCYTQRLPDPDAAARVRVTQAQAVEIARGYVRQHRKWSDIELEGTPTVGESMGKLTWSVSLKEPGLGSSGEGPDSRLIDVDAVTGEIGIIGEPESGPSGRELARLRQASAAGAAATTRPATRRSPGRSGPRQRVGSGSSAPHPSAVGLPWLPLGAGAVALLLVLAGTALVVRRRRRAA